MLSILYAPLWIGDRVFVAPMPSSTVLTVLGSYRRLRDCQSLVPFSSFAQLPLEGVFYYLVCAEKDALSPKSTQYTLAVFCYLIYPRPGWSTCVHDWKCSYFDTTASTSRWYTINTRRPQPYVVWYTSYYPFVYKHTTLCKGNRRNCSCPLYHVLPEAAVTAAYISTPTGMVYTRRIDRKYARAGYAVICNPIGTQTYIYIYICILIV